MRESCAWGSFDGCEEPAGHGKFGSFCAEHAEVLGAIKLDQRVTKPSNPRPDRPTCGLDGCNGAKWMDEPPRCYRHRNVPEGEKAPERLECLVPGCTNVRRNDAGTCRKHTTADLPPEIRAEREATLGKPGPKAKNPC